jgi:Ca2+:H+ antiporter
VIVLAGLAHYVSGVPAVVAFIIAAVALAGAAWMLSFATEQVGERLGPAVTGFMHSSLGNLPEFFVVLFALNAGERVVAETAILGSILVNALLVLGLVIIVGAQRQKDGVMRFGKRLPNDTATLLLVASFIIVLVGLADSSRDSASHHIETISIIGAVAILIVYGTWLRQYLRSESGAGHSSEPPRLSLRTGITMLVVAGAASALVSEWFVDALQPTIHTLHISEAFAGLVIVATAGNAVENLSGVILSWKGRSELAISVVKNSVAQIASFLYPLLVLVSLLTPTTLTFALAPIYIGALLGTAVIVWQITGDGEATVFEGTALTAAFVILATIAWFET